MHFTHLKGHFIAFFTIFVWGLTFSSTKVLLGDFTPAEILFVRFLIAYVLLMILCKNSIGFCPLRYEILFILAGFCGGCLYFLAENIALTYTTASNAALLVAINPFFTGLLMWIFYQKKLSKFFVFGFIFASVGIVLVVFQGSFAIKVNLKGDLLCIAAGLVWSVYTLLLEPIFKHFSHYSNLAIVKKIFFYGLILTLPFMLYETKDIQGFERYLSASNLANLLFLGVFASGLCYVSWNASLRLLGSLKASAYIYAVPVIGVSGACIILKESVNLYIIVGGLLTLFGIFLSQK